MHRELIARVSEVVKAALPKEGGHDWWHIYRVHNMAKQIAAEEGGDLLVIELAALLHDISDPKFNGGDEHAGPIKAKEILLAEGVDAAIVEHVCMIIATMSFKGGMGSRTMEAIEGKIVQDADRLDAMGATGIARAMVFGEHSGRPIYDPSVPRVKFSSTEEYRRHKGTTINHVYEKLLQLKYGINTKTGAELARARHDFMYDFVKRFEQEWAGTA